MPSNPLGPPNLLQAPHKGADLTSQDPGLSPTPWPLRSPTHTTASFSGFTIQSNRLCQGKGAPQAKRSLLRLRDGPVVPVRPSAAKRCPHAGPLSLSVGHVTPYGHCCASAMTSHSGCAARDHGAILCSHGLNP